MDKHTLLNSGLKNFAQKDYTHAIEDLSEAIKLDPNFDLAYNALAECYNKLGNLEKAIETAKKYVQISPEDPVAHTALSRLYVQKGMIAEAEREMALSNQLVNKNK